MGTIANEQVLADCDSQFPQTVDFPNERHGIDNNAISNHANFSAPEYSRGNQMQNVLNAAMDNRVPGIIATLTADNNVGLGGEHVDDFPFSLIAPLRADQNCIRHRN
jgi:hypothetical protein